MLASYNYVCGFNKLNNIPNFVQMYFNSVALKLEMGAMALFTWLSGHFEPVHMIHPISLILASGNEV